MFETKAYFQRKEPKLETQDCVVAKVIRLPSAAFHSFSNNLLRDHDFISEANRTMRPGEGGKHNCLLVIGEGQRDGILVDSGGYDYARYTALFPNAEDFLIMSQYPALAALNNKLTMMVNIIAEQAGAVNPDGSGTVDLQQWGKMLDIDFATNSTLRSTVLAMLDARPEIRDWSLDKDELTLWKNTGDAPLAAEELADPSVTPADMYAYGYTWDGMIPLGKERAFELYDEGYTIYRLYEDDAEGMIDTREEIEHYDGLFGTEDPNWKQPERIRPFQAFIVSSAKQSNGENVGEWLTLPTDADTLQGLLERIGVEKPNQAAFHATALRMPIEDELREYVNIHDGLDKLNMLASFVDDMEDYELDKLQAILSTNIADLSGCDIDAVINLIHEENFTAFQDRLRTSIDAVLEQNPAIFEDFLKLLRDAGVTVIEGGKHLKLLAAPAEGLPDQVKPTRCNTLKGDYTEAAIRERIMHRQEGRLSHSESVEQGLRVRSSAGKAFMPEAQGRYSLLIDIQAKIQQGKGPGYERWAKLHNLKQMAQTLIYLQEQGLDDYDSLNERASAASARFNKLSEKIKTLDAGMAANAELQKQIVTYSKTRKTYTEYRNAGYSKKFKALHEADILLHQTAKKYFDELGYGRDKKLPTVASLRAEYATMLTEKKKAHREYRLAKSEMQSLIMARSNVQRLLNIIEGAERERGKPTL